MTRTAPPIMLATAASLPWRRCLLPTVMLALAACSSVPKVPLSSTVAPSGNQANAGPGSHSLARLPVLPPAGSGRGGYYQDDGPGDKPPDGLLDLPDAIPKIEPYSLTGNKPYVVFGKRYAPLLDQRSYKQRGIGSWYGKKFHGQKTSSGEPYDMYKLTAAHPTLPIPSYARVTNLNNGVQVIVRINDRGPFHSSRIIDLSYTAALKLGYLGKGSGELEVERLLPEDIARMADARQPAQALGQVAAAPLATGPVLAELPPAPMEVSPMTAQSAERLPISAAPLIVKRLVTAVNPGGGAATATSLDNSGALSGNWDLQLGAFTEVDNAEAVRARLMQTWDSSLPPPEVMSVGFFYRLHSGPFSTRSEAARAARKVRMMSEIKPVVVQR